MHKDPIVKGGAEPVEQEHEAGEGSQAQGTVSMGQEPLGSA